MDKVIATAMLIVVSMVLVVLLFNAAYPAIVEGGDALVSMTDRQNDRFRSQITVIHAITADDVDENGVTDASIWVKNVGETRIAALERLDIFFGSEGNFQRIPPTSEVSTGIRWEPAIVNAAEWDPTATLRITIHDAPVIGGRYFVKVITPNGVSDEYFWSH